jgi:predicted DNA-binding transcriptional regulator YafY
VNRTDRLYALVEELRAISPRCRSARELSARIGVSVRTVERDVSALQQAGVPIYAEAGKRGGYAIDKTASPAPLTLTPAEAVAVAVVLSQAREHPFAADARSASRKLVAAMPVPGGEPAAEMASRVGTPGAAEDAEAASEARAAIARVIEEALEHRRVIRLVYVDRSGVSTERDVEPGVFIGGRGGFWYLVGWCRLREDVRVFRLDRIASAAITGEPARARRELEEYAPDIPDLIARDSTPG